MGVFREAIDPAPVLAVALAVVVALAVFTLAEVGVVVGVLELAAVCVVVAEDGPLCFVPVVACAVWPVEFEEPCFVLAVCVVAVVDVLDVLDVLAEGVADVEELFAMLVFPLPLPEQKPTRPPAEVTVPSPLPILPVLVLVLLIAVVELVVVELVVDELAGVELVAVDVPLLVVEPCLFAQPLVVDEELPLEDAAREPTLPAALALEVLLVPVELLPCWPQFPLS
jgi:hypothetical protein